MSRVHRLFLLLLIVACGDRTQPTTLTTVDTVTNVADSVKKETLPTAPNPYGFDTTFEISKEHQPFMVTGYFNPDDILDTAILVRHKSTGKDALLIKHGGTDKSFLLKNGKDVGSDFDDFHWVEQFKIMTKGRKIWSNVVDGEIVGDEQVPDNEKITLQTDGIFIHEDEGGGGGIIYFKNEKYVWVQQD